jgi:hypothetical protein
MSPARKTARQSRSTWWLLPLGVAVAAWAIWALATSDRGPGASNQAQPAPEAEIGDESREALRDILRGADAGEPTDDGTASR